jgi:Fur family transcriptional regulator, zinc uptake regulator
MLPGMDAVSPRIDAMLNRASALCETRGARLTDLRRAVLALILEAPGPTGAYELLDRLRARRGTAAPPTVYRALEFLQQQGLVHKIERLAAFVGCPDDHAHVAGHAHSAQFLICHTCGQVIEIEDAALARALAAAAQRAGFVVTRATIEAEGLCAHCAPADGVIADGLSPQRVAAG